MTADGVARRYVELSREQALHERLMQEVLRRIPSTGLVLKGGSALAFCYGAGRHSTDLDFDARRRVDLRGIIRRAGRAAGVEMQPVERKPRKKKERFHGPYVNPFKEGPALLKVDVRWKTAPVRRDIVVVGGVRTYKVEAIYDQKVAALKSRKEARDLFDLAFVMKSYGERLRDDQIRWADSYLSDRKRVRRRYAKEFEHDEVLKGVTTFGRTLAGFGRATAAQRRQRRLQVQCQSIPVPMAVIGRVYAYQSRQRMAALEGTGSAQVPSPTRWTGLRATRGARMESSADREKDLNRSFER